MSRTAGERGDVSLKPFEAANEPEITQTSPPGERENHEKYSAENIHTLSRNGSHTLKGISRNNGTAPGRARCARDVGDGRLLPQQGVINQETGQSSLEKDNR
jgi:hypothetical protein